VLLVNTTTRLLLAIGAVGALGLAACGDDDASTTSTAAGAAAPATTAAPAPAPADDPYGYEVDRPAATSAPAAEPALAGAATVVTAETEIGTVLVDRDGRTLYGFTEDTEGQPTCVEGCADAWPPALVDGEPELGDLDAAVFTVVEHPDGSQLKAGDWPLYTFAGDSAPGDVTGQGSGGVWFAVAPDGSLIR